MVIHTRRGVEGYITVTSSARRGFVSFQKVPCATASRVSSKLIVRKKVYNGTPGKFELLDEPEVDLDRIAPEDIKFCERLIMIADVATTKS